MVMAPHPGRPPGAHTPMRGSRPSQGREQEQLCITLIRSLRAAVEALDTMDPRFKTAPRALHIETDLMELYSDVIEQYGIR